MIGSCPCQVLRRTRAALVRLRAAGGARVSLAFGWALRSGSCRLGCALVGAASYTNGLGMALLSPSMCHSSRECRGRCLMGMDRYAILLLLLLLAKFLARARERVGPGCTKQAAWEGKSNHACTMSQANRARRSVCDQ